MKQCPKCKRNYEDDTLRFCLEDGTALVQEGEGVRSTVASPTAVLPTEPPAATTMSSIGPPDVPGLQEKEANQPASKHRTLEQSGSPVVARVVGALLLAASVVVTGIGLALWTTVFMRRIPLFLFLMTMMLVAIIRAGRHPKTSLLAGIAIGFDIITTFTYTAVIRVIPLNLHEVLEVLDSFVVAGIMILLTAAVLTERTSRPALN